MKISHHKGTFTAADLTQNEVAVLHAAGWTWRPSQKAFVTTRILRVVPFLSGCDVETRALVQAFATKREADVADSIAMDVEGEFPCPEGLAYRGYQKAGIHFMRARKKTLNADAMRLGKTVQTLGVINSYPRVLNVLIICPANAKVNWTREAEKWLIHKESIGYCEGKDNPDTRFLVINYDILGKHIDAIRARRWDIIAVDEAHSLGNPKSQRSKFVFSLDAELHVMLLTGTPIYTRPKQLWPMLQYMDPQGLGRNWFTFMMRYCDGKKINKFWNADGATHQEELQYKLRKSVMVRREKRDVSKELPTERTTVVLPKTGLVKLLKEEKATVTTHLRKLMDMISSGNLTEEEIQAIAEFDGRNDLTTGPVATIRRELALAKLPMVYEFLQEVFESEHKVVVFAHHRDAVNEIYEHVRFDMGISAVKVIGGMSTTVRQKQVDQFREDPNCRVFVANITAAGSAVSLAASDCIVFAELSWIPSEIDQAEERIWDVLKTNPLMVYRLVVDDSLEQAIAGMLEVRQKSISRTIDRRHLTGR